MSELTILCCECGEIVTYYGENLESIIGQLPEHDCKNKEEI